MQGKNHIALALAIPLAGAAILDTTLPQGLAWAALVLGSLAPDIDGDGAITHWGNFLPGHITPRPVIKSLNWTGSKISSVIRAIFGHRNALHAPLWGFLMMAAGVGVIGKYDSDLLLWFGIGYVLHIFGDSLTKSGVPVLWPLSGRDFSVTPMVTGKWVERIFGYILWLFVTWRLGVEILPVARELFNI